MKIWNQIWSTMVQLRHHFILALTLSLSLSVSLSVSVKKCRSPFDSHPPPTLSTLRRQKIGEFAFLTDSVDPLLDFRRRRRWRQIDKVGRRRRKRQRRRRQSERRRKDERPPGGRIRKRLRPPRLRSRPTHHASDSPGTGSLRTKSFSDCQGFDSTRFEFENRSKIPLKWVTPNLIESRLHGLKSHFVKKTIVI